MRVFCCFGPFTLVCIVLAGKKNAISGGFPLQFYYFFLNFEKVLEFNEEKET